MAAEGLFNMMHLESGIKVDLIIRRSDEFRRVEVERRTAVNLANIQTRIVSREDLKLSKLVWARRVHGQAISAAALEARTEYVG